MVASLLTTKEALVGSLKAQLEEAKRKWKGIEGKLTVARREIDLLHFDLGINKENLFSIAVEEDPSETTKIAMVLQAFSKQAIEVSAVNSSGPRRTPG